ncbi:MAG: hypothetical protein HQM14_19500 [SAR324 cluster bacterium]|nr:hypothetical protein [SAR324 cluster bacterium]
MKKLITLLLALIFGGNLNAFNLAEVQTLADAGNPYFQGLLGTEYRRGNLLERNYKEALYLLRK